MRTVRSVSLSAAITIIISINPCVCVYVCMCVCACVREISEQVNLKKTVRFTGLVFSV